jgi:hypothetical protein
MKIEFSGQNFEKYSNTKFYENSSSGSRVVACGWACGRKGHWIGRQTDRHDEANSHVSYFVNVHKNGRNLSITSNLLYVQLYFSHVLFLPFTCTHHIFNKYIYHKEYKHFLMFRLHCQLQHRYRSLQNCFPIFNSQQL